MISYTHDGKHAIFQGELYTRDDQTNFYLRTRAPRIRLHRAVWTLFHGDIPNGYEVHHIDHDRLNNEPENLELLSVSKHHARHAAEMTDAEMERVRENFIKHAVPAAAEWHGSDTGKRWHKEHYQKTKEALHKQELQTCDYCGKSFVGLVRAGNHFCSNTCKSAFRRKCGFDMEKRTCVICGGEFIVNQYSKTKCCSRNCAARLRCKNQKHSKAASGTGI